MEHRLFQLTIMLSRFDYDRTEHNQVVHLRGADTSTSCWTSIRLLPTTWGAPRAYESRRLVARLSSCVTRHAVLHAGTHVSFPLGSQRFAEAVLCALIKHNITVTLDLLRRQKTIDPCIKPSRMACGSRRNLTSLPVQYALFSESWCAGSVAASTLQPGRPF